jgi:thymidylate synthase (FAD)
MDVSVLAQTDHPDRLAVACGRGDYMADSLVDVDVSDDSDMDAVVDAVSIDHTFSHLDTVNTELDEKVANMIHKFINRGHWGVFEHPTITVAVEGISRSCMAQLTRHRHISFDVQSMRYVKFKNASYVTPPSLASKEKTYDFEQAMSIDAYQTAVDSDIPKEDARMMLPIGTKVNLTMTLNLRTLFHVANLRAKANAQWEIRSLTEQLLGEARNWAPISMALFDEQTPMKISP